MSGQLGKRDRSVTSAAIAGIVLLTPLVLVGVLWTASLVGGYLGAPVLVLTLPAVVTLWGCATTGTRPEWYVLASVGSMVVAAVIVVQHPVGADVGVGGLAWLLAFLGCLAQLGRHPARRQRTPR